MPGGAGGSVSDVRVALIVEWLDAWRGGAETSTQQFIQHLLALGVTLEVFTRSRVSPRPGLAVHTILASGPSRALKTVAFCKRADDAARACGCDVVHAFAPSLVADVYQPRGGMYAETIRRNVALRRSRSARAVKRIAQYLNLKQQRMLQLERRMLRGRDRPLVLALSDYVVAQLREHYDLPPERIRKVFNGVDPDVSGAEARAANRRDVRALYEIRERDVLALMVAHNFKLKGLRPLIDALTLLERRVEAGRLKVLVVGKGRVARWRELVERRGLGARLQFPGATQRVTAFYHAADFLIHPTYYDPCSRVVLEALASGLPVITTRYDGAAEVVEEGVSGFVLADPDDVHGLAGHMVRLEDDAVRAAMGVGAARVGERAAMQRHAAEVYSVYQTIVNGASRS